MLSKRGAFVAGALTFASAHVIEMAFWHAWFGGHKVPWFLNATQAMAFTLSLVAVGSGVVAAVNPRPSGSGLGFAAGAVLGMTIVLFVGPGPGNLFPIVLAFGGALILVASVVGAWLGGLFARVLPGR